MRFDPARVEIRELAESDMDTVIGLVELLEEGAHWPRQTFVEMLSGEFLSRRIALVAQESHLGEVVGFAVASSIPPEAELENIAVAPECQRRGIGRQLLSGLVEELKRSGIETVHLEVRASNLAAVGLYKSFGFKATGLRTRYYSNPVEDAVLMTCELR
jgi:ribosomal-protein-alanine N-acetyltransferase